MTLSPLGRTLGLVRCGGNHSGEDLQRASTEGSTSDRPPYSTQGSARSARTVCSPEGSRHRTRMPQFRLCPAMPWSSCWSFTSDRAGVPASPCCQYRGQSLAVSDGDGEGGMAQGAGWLDAGDGFAEGDAQAACTVSGHG